MEAYRETIKLENILLTVGCFTMAAFALLAIGSELGWFSFVRPTVGDGHWHSSWYGFVTGASCGLLALMVVFLIRNHRALKNEAKLKKMYIKRHDERSNQIVILARNTAMQLMLWLGIMATVIAGYFSKTVSLTILACTFVSSCLSLALVGYYSKRM